MPSRPRRDAAGIATDDRVIVEKMVQLVSDHLRLQRHIRASAALFHQVVPGPHPFLRRLQEAAVRLLMDQRKQRPKHIAAASGQAHFDGMAQADPDGINVNLDGPRLPGLRIELNVREAAAGNDQGVALFERLLREHVGGLCRRRGHALQGGAVAAKLRADAQQDGRLRLHRLVVGSLECRGGLWGSGRCCFHAHLSHEE